MAAAAVGLGPLAAARIVEAAERGAKPSVIWLQFQECTGCTESLLRTSHPGDRRLDPRFDLARLPRDAVRGRRSSGRSRAPTGDAQQCRQVRVRRRGRDPDQGERDLLHDRRPHGPRHREGRRRAGRGGDCHRVVRVVGRRGFGRSQSDRRRRRARGAEGQDRGEHPRLSGQSLQLPRHGPAVRHVRHAAGARRAKAVRSSPTARRFTSTVRAGRISTPADSPTGSATKGTATATASTSSDARGR